MPFVKGQPGGPGRRPKSIKFARPIARAEKQIADHLPELIDNLFVLANGGYERVEEEWQPAGLVYVGSGEFARRAFPELEPDVLVMVKRKSSIADKDRQANEYLVNRILGKPTERAEVAQSGDLTIKVQYGSDRSSEEAAPAPAGVHRQPGET
jgi:hypothetical protein